MNNFEQFEQKERAVHGAPSPKVKKNINGTLKIYKHLTSVVELYVPQMVNMIIAALGGTIEKKPKQFRNKYPNK